MMRRNAVTNPLGGQITPGNIDLNNRPVVKNRDGSISTVRSITVTGDGRSFLIPTVSPDGRIMRDRDAIDHFRRSGQHLGVFRNQESADRYAVILHESQASKYLPRQMAEKKLARPARPMLGAAKRSII